MCPDVQLLSIYKDEELPSPWKEKLETHLSECPECREKLNKFKLIEKPAASELHAIDEAKDRIWKNLQSRRSFQPRVGSGGSSSDSSIWRRKLSIPFPAAAAAAVILTLITVMWLRSGQINNSGLAKQADPYERTGFLISAEEEEIPGIMQVADINSVIQYLNSDSSDIIILRLPESKNFSRTGEPAILRAADFQQNENIINNNSGRKKGSKDGSSRRQQ